VLPVICIATVLRQGHVRLAAKACCDIGCISAQRGVLLMQLALFRTFNI